MFKSLILQVKNQNEHLFTQLKCNEKICMPDTYFQHVMNVTWPCDICYDKKERTNKKLSNGQRCTI